MNEDPPRRRNSRSEAGGSDAEPQEQPSAPRNPIVRRLPQRKYYSLPAALLFIDDIERIEADFRAICRRDCRIEADGYELASAAAITALQGNEVHELEIHCAEPYVTFEWRGFDGRIYVSDADDLQLAGLVSRVQQIVAQRQSRKFLKPYDQRYLTLRRRSTDPTLVTSPPNWLDRHPEVAAAIVGSVLTALLGIVATLLLVWLQIVRVG